MSSLPRRSCDPDVTTQNPIPSPLRLSSVQPPTAIRTREVQDEVDWDNLTLLHLPHPPSPQHQHHTCRHQKEEKGSTEHPLLHQSSSPRTGARRSVSCFDHLLGVRIATTTPQDIERERYNTTRWANDDLLLTTDPIADDAHTESTCTLTPPDATSTSSTSNSSSNSDDEDGDEDEKEDPHAKLGCHHPPLPMEGSTVRTASLSPSHQRVVALAAEVPRQGTDNIDDCVLVPPTPPKPTKHHPLHVLHSGRSCTSPKWRSECTTPPPPTEDQRSAFVRPVLSAPRQPLSPPALPPSQRPVSTTTSVLAQQEKAPSNSVSPSSNSSQSPIPLAPLSPQAKAMVAEAKSRQAALRRDQESGVGSRTSPTFRVGSPMFIQTRSSSILRGSSNSSRGSTPTPLAATRKLGSLPFLSRGSSTSNFWVSDAASPTKIEEGEDEAVGVEEEEENHPCLRDIGIAENAEKNEDQETTKKCFALHAMFDEEDEEEEEEFESLSFRSPDSVSASFAFPTE